MSVNKVILVGRLGADPESKSTPSGRSVANFSVATDEKWTDKQGEKQEQTEWHRVVVWGKLAELCGKYLQKGRQVYLEGKLATRKWTDKDGIDRYTTEVVSDKVVFLGSGDRQQSDGGGSTAPRGGPPPARGGGAPPSGPDFNDDDEIPF